jgi:hypothetical protein
MRIGVATKIHFREDTRELGLPPDVATGRSKKVKAEGARWMSQGWQINKQAG